MKLIRATTEPDRFPESYDHVINIYLGMTDDTTPSNLIKRSNGYSTECDVVTMGVESGDLEPSGKLYDLEGDVVVSAVKRSEDGMGVIYRVYEPNGREAECVISSIDATEANVVDINEEPVSDLAIADGKVRFTVKPYSVITVRLSNQTTDQRRKV